MHERGIILGIAVVILLYGWFSKLLIRYNITGPMVFTVVGVLFSPLVFGAKEIDTSIEIVQVISEIALIVVLFSDAAVLNIAQLKKEWRLPVRLLFVALPITIILAFFTGRVLFPNESILYILLLALILAPTDAALGKAVLSSRIVPQRIRNAINVESGLNDGIVFPILLTLLAVISSGNTTEGNGWLGYIAQQIIIGAVAGGFAGWVGAIISAKSKANDWMESNYLNLIPIALAIFSYYFAEHFGGNGYIAAFFAGLFLGNSNIELKEHIESFAESEGEFLVMVSFLIFGLAFIPQTIEYWNTKAFVYAVLSLSIIRMLPVALAFGKFDLSLKDRLFIGWFGPRGIASILYIIVAVTELGGIKGHEEIFGVASLTITLSIVLHGLSAKPLSYIYKNTPNS